MATRKIEQSERAREAEGEGVPFSLADVKQLVESLEGTDVTGFVWKRGAEKVVIRRGHGGGPAIPMAVHAAPVAPAIPAPPAPAAAPAAVPAAAAAPKAAEKPGPS